MVNGKKVGVLVVAYNAISHLANVFKRIPGQAWEDIDEIAIFDDASHDATYELACGYKLTNKLDKLQVYKNRENLGYGGNQKKGFKYFADKNFDVVVLLHGDGQYAPEMLPEMYAPICADKADIVFGSRMMGAVGRSLGGGMPLYKFLGNRILTFYENKMLGMELTEFHSGYRAYSLSALKSVALDNCTNDFHFDTEIIVKLNHHRFRFLEIPIPTYYGTEICHVNGMRYAYDVAKTVWEYKKTINGEAASFTYKEFQSNAYASKPYRFSSHDLAAGCVRGRKARVLDIGCGDGTIETLPGSEHHEFVGVDIREPETNAARFSKFFRHDLGSGLPDGVKTGERYDFILLLDILEHLPQPEKLLAEVFDVAQDAAIVVSVPNVANVYMRLNLLFGRFEYMQRGLLDENHLRFFTKSSFEKLLRKSGFRVEKRYCSVLPLRDTFHTSGTSLLERLGNRILHLATRIFDTLLAYQFVFVCRKSPQKG